MAGEHDKRARARPSRLSPRVLRIAVVGVLALLLSLVSLGSGASTSSGTSVPRSGAPRYIGISADALVVPLVLASVAMLGLLVLLWPGRRRKRRDDDPDWVYEAPPVPWWERVLVVAGALLPLGGLVAALVLLRSGSQGQLPAPVTGRGVPPTTSAGPAPPAEPTAGLDWQFLLVVVGAVALMVVVLLGVLWLARRRAPAGNRVAIPDGCGSSAGTG